MQNKSLFTYKLLVFLAVLVVLGSLLFRLGFGSEIANTNIQAAAPVQKLQKTGITLPGSAINVKDTTLDLGVYLQNSPAHNFADVVAFERILGYDMDYVLFFHAWGDVDAPFPTSYFEYLKPLGLTPIFTWEPWKRDFENAAAVQPEYTLRSIVEGKHDEYIISWAKAAKQQDTPIIIRFAHEMNTNGNKSWYPWQGEAENYIQAYRRIANLFRWVGANKVEFMWNPISYGTDESAIQFYPGDNYVDVIGFTLINMGDTGNRAERTQWRECDDIFYYQYNQLKHLNKPFIIAETLSTDLGGDKGDWFADCFREFSKVSSVKAMLFYQTNDIKPSWKELGFDWRITDNPQTLAKVQAAIERYVGLN